MKGGHPKKKKLGKGNRKWGGKGAAERSPGAARGGKAGGGRGREGVGPGAAGDRWVDTKSRQMDGGGRREAGGQWLEALMRLELGSGLRRGEWRGKKKGQAASGDKDSEAWGPGWERARARGGGQPRLAAERVTDCVVRHSGDPLSPSRGTERETQKDRLTQTGRLRRPTRRWKFSARCSRASLPSGLLPPACSCDPGRGAALSPDETPPPWGWGSGHSGERVRQRGTARVNAVCSPCQPPAWLGPQGSPHMSPPLLPSPLLPSSSRPSPHPQGLGPGPCVFPALQPPTRQSTSHLPRRLCRREKTAGDNLRK